MQIVIGGHVDHGKSTIIGRLLADTGSLPQGKLEQVREQCRRTARPFEYAFLLDALKDNKPEGDGNPERGEKSKSQPDKKGGVPPSTPKRPSAKELQGVFLAKLPDKVREAVENGDFDQVPEKYRDLIREWTKALSAADKEATGGADESK